MLQTQGALVLRLDARGTGCSQQSLYCIPKKNETEFMNICIQEWRVHVYDLSLDLFCSDITIAQNMEFRLPQWY